MSTLRGVGLVFCFVGNLAAAQQFDGAWLVLACGATVIGAWIVGLFDGAAAASNSYPDGGK